MASRPQTPATYGGVPEPDESHINRGYGAGSASQSRADIHANTAVDDFAPNSAPVDQHLSHDTDAAHPHDLKSSLERSPSSASTTAVGDAAVSRSNTLKKRQSVNGKGSVRRSASRKSQRAGSIRGATPHEKPLDPEYQSVFHTPIPTQSSPTEILANRFNAWRTYLKSLITYFREIQTSYDQRAKTIMKVSNVVSNTQAPTVFLTEGGLNEATRILSDYHKHALNEANKSRDIEIDVIQALNGLRADLGAKIKEIKGLSGDFKNTVDKEKEGTRKAVAALGDALQKYDHADGSEKAGNDPFIVRLSVDRMVERQIDEENYLHRAYLNLETSGRELEAIVVGEIQKAFNAIAGILRREGDDAYTAVEALRAGPITMQKDYEWNQFVGSDPHFIDPALPLRRVQDVTYPGREHPAAAEIRAGMLERKSKYLKSYSPGWYVLSPTHIHEFKSADNIYSQPPVMSLYLGDQKLGSHSGPESSSHKFMLKGRQSGGMHRGHSWVFRAESYETMMAWFDAIKSLTEKTGAERNAFVRQHARSVSGQSHRALSVSSDGIEDDEADHVPYAASVQDQQLDQPAEELKPQRPQPGGRFPSDMNIPRRETVSDNSSEPEQERDTIAAVAVPAALSHENDHFTQEQRQPTPAVNQDTNPYHLEGIASHGDEPRRDRTAEAGQTTSAYGNYSEPRGVDGSADSVDPFYAHQQQPQPQATTEQQQFAAPVDHFHEQRRVQPPQLANQYRATPPVSPYYPQESSIPDPNQYAPPLDPSYAQHRQTQSSTATDASRSAPAVDTPPRQSPVPTQTFVLPLHSEAPTHQIQEDIPSPTYHVQEERPSSVITPITTQPLPTSQDWRPIPQEPVRQHSSYAEWMAPTAAAATGIGAGVLGEQVYEHHQEQRATMLPPTSTTRDANPQIDTNDFVNAPRSSTSTDYPRSSMSQSTAPTSVSGYTGPSSSSSPSSGGLGGLEKEGAHATGRMFPRVVRHDTDMSVSMLHVPGEFPKGGGSGVSSPTELGR